MADARTGWTARVERGSLSQSTAVNTISRKAAPALVQEHEGPPDRRVQILSGTPGSNRRPSPYGAVRAGRLDGNNQEERASAGGARSRAVPPCRGYPSPQIIFAEASASCRSRNSGC